MSCYLKSNKKIIDQIIFKNLLKIRFQYFYTLCRCVRIVIGYFLFEKQAFNGLLKVIGIENELHIILIFVQAIQWDKQE